MVAFGLLAVQAGRLRRQCSRLHHASAYVAPPGHVALAPIAPAPLVRLVSVEKVEWDSRHMDITYHCGCSNTVSVWLYSIGSK
ncbi:hypothetical protein Bca4012_000248 [Brassica carinata]|uniref:Uncharacterized protein n=2 Tax=Brassica TaxID=3705 RepID=A0A8X7WSD3_BRACI|nr:hypothetical protein Bca52824_005952 [Brassica carinata]VDC85353.1 unnamed protein product [Brassica oleracea]